MSTGHTSEVLLYLVPLAFGLFLLIDFLFTKEKKNFLSRAGKVLLVPLILIVGTLIYLYRFDMREESCPFL